MRDRVERLAGAAGIIAVPLLALLAFLVVRLATLSGLRGGREGGLDLTMDVQSLVRWVIVAGLVLAAVVVARALYLKERARRRGS